MFDVPFKSGGPWTQADDDAKARVVVLSERLAQTLFGEEEAVGKMVTFNDEPFRVTGVLSHWRPLPKFFDVTNGALNTPEAAYLPFTTAVDKELDSWGNNNCFSNPGEGRAAPGNAGRQRPGCCHSPCCSGTGYRRWW